MTDVTKSCVRMLKFERTIRGIIKFPFVLLCDIIEKLCGWINWCITRSFFRLFGIPLIICCFAVIVNALRKYGVYDPWSGIDVIIILGSVVIMVLILCITLYSWMEISDKEQKILDGKDD